MKKLLSIVLVMFMVFVLVGCGPAKPEDTVSDFFKAVKVFDTKAIAVTLSDGKPEDIVDGNVFKEEDENSAFTDMIKNNMKKLTYKITDTKIDGDKAVVSVSCKYVDAGPLLKATFEEYITKVFETAFSGVEMTQTEVDKLLGDIMLEQRKKIPETFKEKDIKIDLIKKDDKWVINKVNDDLLDVIMSGLSSAFAGFSEDFTK